MRSKLTLVPLVGALILMAALLSVSVYGLYLAFSASIVIGILALMFEPSPFVIGILMIGFDYNIPQAIIDFISR